MTPPPQSAGDVGLDAPRTDAGGPTDAALDAGPEAAAPDAGPPEPSFRVLPYLSEAPVRSFSAPPTMMLDASLQYRAEMVTDVGTMRFRLYAEQTPNTVNSFVFLARHHFYEGIAFHRVIEGFVVQGGDPNTVSGPPNTWGRGGPGYGFGIEIVPELIFEGPGVLGMARSASPNSNGSQFYVTYGSTPSLNGQYTVFGQLIENESFLTLTRVAPGQPPRTPTRIVRVDILVAPR